jgi:YlmC/YmxH family sporulation protein
MACAVFPFTAYKYICGLNGGLFMFKISDLRNKDVVNSLDGKRLGFIRDIDIDLAEGRIKALILPGESRLMGLFGRNDDIIIEWGKIKRIGVDVILVELSGCAEISAAAEDKYSRGKKNKAVLSEYPDDVYDDFSDLDFPDSGANNFEDYLPRRRENAPSKKADNALPGKIYDWKQSPLWRESGDKSLKSSPGGKAPFKLSSSDNEY